MADDLVTVPIRAGDCPCPGSPHAVEEVRIIPALDLPMAAGALAAIRLVDSEPALIQAALIRSYLPTVIRSWSFLESDGTGGIRPVPITRDNLERLVPWQKGGLALADACDEQYSDDLLSPLLARPSTLLQAGPMAVSTSASLRSGPRRPRRSRRSSRNGTAGMSSVAPVS
jgi:hypothetical protein